MVSVDLSERTILIAGGANVDGGVRAWRGSANNIDVHIGQLRRRDDNPDQPRIVQNVRGVGFRLRS